MHGKALFDYNFLMKDRFLEIHRLASSGPSEIGLNRPPEESSESIPGLQRLDQFGQSMLTLQTESREEQGIEGNFILGED